MSTVDLDRFAPRRSVDRTVAPDVLARRRGNPRHAGGPAPAERGTPRAGRGSGGLRRLAAAALPTVLGLAAVAALMSLIPRTPPTPPAGLAGGDAVTVEIEAPGR